MLIELTTTTGQTLLQLSGRFDFTTRSQFIAQADDAISRASSPEIGVDMSGVDYIDSSALGMLLMLRDKAKKLDKAVFLINPSGYVRQVIVTAQFDRLFAIH